jgi:SpoVK/Ycf46/Vps4 family AAA+-type ATPase
MKNAIQAMRSEDTKRVPRGILMVGPPGTGKTMLTHALARDLGSPSARKADVGIGFVRLRNIHSCGIETRSDWDLHRALNVIRSLVPVVVFVDEIDKIGSRVAVGATHASPVQGEEIGYANGDMRERKLIDQLINDLIRFVGDPSLRGKVLWIAASNRPDMIHPEFRKPGRFDDVIPFLLPGSKDREDILKKIFSRNAIPYDNRIDFSAPAHSAEYCTGADLEVIAMRSYQNARRNDRDTVTEQDLIKAAGEFIPRHDPDVYEYMMLLAIREASLASLVPKPLDGGLQDKVYENNKVSKARINQRLRELEGQIHLRRGRRRF